jgi:CTP synthase
MQTAIIEFARNVIGLADSHSSEFAPECDNAVISLMEDQQHVTDMGGTMRLGAYPARLAPGTRVREIYGEEVVYERHRHRYEFNNKYAAQLQSRGLVLSGKCAGRELVEIIELPDHPWFLAVQFHPELKSRPHEPHPLFVDFVRAALERRRARRGDDRYLPGETAGAEPPPTATDEAGAGTHARARTP